MFQQNIVGLGSPRFLDTITDVVRSFAADPKVIQPFPPHDIIATGENEYAIHLALAGFAPEDVGIELQDRTLTISGKRNSQETEANYLYRGIAGRSFEKKFQLGQYVEVASANFKHGLLIISLARRVPEDKRVRKIEIVADKPASAE